MKLNSDKIEEEYSVQVKLQKTNKNLWGVIAHSLHPFFKYHKHAGRYSIWKKQLIITAVLGFSFDQKSLLSFLNSFVFLH